MTESKTVVLVLFCLLQILGPVTSRDAYFLKETEVIPRNSEEYRMLTKGLKCEGENMGVAYVLHSIEMKTLMVCTPNKNLSGNWCPEFNPDNIHSQNGRVQPKFNAECKNMSITPCKQLYRVWESYLYFECFQKFGSIASPSEIVKKLKQCEEKYKNSSLIIDEKESIINEKQQDIEAYKNSSENCEQKLELCEERYKNVSQVVDEKEDIINEMSSKNSDKDGTVNLEIIATILIAIILCCLCYIFLFPYLIKKFYYKENITYWKYIGSRIILFKYLFTSASDISVGIGRAENRTPHTGTASEMKAINEGNGEEEEKEQGVGVDVRKVNDQHPGDTVITVEGTNKKLW